jgi:hypothetical protein
MRSAGRRSVVFVAATLALSCAAGCGGSDDESTSTASVITAPTTTTTPATTTATTTASQSTTTGGDDTSAAGPGEGAGAPIVAAAGVLTTHATPEQACGSFVTQNFIETAYGGKENCLEARKSQPLAKRIAVDQSSPQTTTHLVVVPEGGPYDGAKVEVDIVQDGSNYRVDGLDAHVPAGP